MAVKSVCFPLLQEQSKVGLGRVLTPMGRIGCLVFIYLNSAIKGSLMYKTVYFIIPSIIIV